MSTMSCSRFWLIVLHLLKKSISQKVLLGTKEDRLEATCKATHFLSLIISKAATIRP